MKSILVYTLSFLFCISGYAQLPGPVIGTAVAIPAGSFNCVQQAFPAPIGVSGEPSQVTFCFNYYNIGPINMSFILVNGLCGPFPLYNSLAFSIYDSAATQLVVSGTIVPVSNNATISSLIPNTWYNVCYTWTPNCAQFSACPLIYTSGLPVELLGFTVTTGKESNIIHWSTASQSEVDSFIVEKSWDLRKWTNVGIVKGVGNTSSQMDYSMEDIDLSTGTLYYRLSEKLYSGQVNILKTVSLRRIAIPMETRVYDMLGRTMGRDFRGIKILTDGIDNKVIVE